MSYKNGKRAFVNRSIETEHISIYYPELKLGRRKNRYLLNNYILNMLNQCIENVKDNLNEKTKLYGEYKLMVIKKDLISIIFQIYFFDETNNSTFDILKSITVNPKKGQIYNFEDLFAKNSDFKNRINELILLDIRDNNIPIIQEFTKINKSKNFYLTDTSLIVYFDIFKDSQYAGVYCTPQFTIPYKAILDIIDFKGPIGNLIKK